MHVMNTFFFKSTLSEDRLLSNTHSYRKRLFKRLLNRNIETSCVMTYFYNVQLGSMAELARIHFAILKPSCCGREQGEGFCFILHNSAKCVRYDILTSRSLLWKMAHCLKNQDVCNETSLYYRREVFMVIYCLAMADLEGS